MDKKEIETFADEAPVEQLRKFVLIMAQILNKVQIKAIEPYFVKKVEFSYPPEEIGLEPLKSVKKSRQKKKVKPDPEPEPEEVEEPEEEEIEEEGVASNVEGDAAEAEVDGKEEPDDLEPEDESKPDPEEEDPELDYEDYLTEDNRTPVTPKQAEKEFNEVVNRQAAP